MTKETNKTETLPGGITTTQLNQWKAKHGAVSQVKVPLNDEETEYVYCYFKKPTLDIIGAAAKFAETDPVKSGNILFESCYLGGDAEVKEIDECRMSAMQALSSMFKVRASEIKNL